MSVEKALRDILVADADLKDVVGSRIYPNAFPQNPTWPAIIFRRLKTKRDYAIDGPSDMYMPDIEYVVCSPNYDDTRDIAMALCSALDGVRGVHENVKIASTLVIDDKDTYDDKLKVHRAEVLVSVWYAPV